MCLVPAFFPSLASLLGKFAGHIKRDDQSADYLSLRIPAVARHIQVRAEIKVHVVREALAIITICPMRVRLIDHDRLHSAIVGPKSHCRPLLRPLAHNRTGYARYGIAQWLDRDRRVTRPTYSQLPQPHRGQTRRPIPDALSCVAPASIGTMHDNWGRGLRAPAFCARAS